MIPVPERAVSDIQIGETVAVNVSGGNQTFDGKIVRFSDQIDTATRTMHTEVDVPNPKFVLVPGMYASVKIPLHSAEERSNSARTSGPDHQSGERDWCWLLRRTTSSKGARYRWDCNPRPVSKLLRACRKTKPSFLEV